MCQQRGDWNNGRRSQVCGGYSGVWSMHTGVCSVHTEVNSVHSAVGSVQCAVCLWVHTAECAFGCSLQRALSIFSVQIKCALCYK